jgi:hypothetical protein
MQRMPVNTSTSPLSIITGIDTMIVFSGLRSTL